jgi:hypothetical protein
MGIMAGSSLLFFQSVLALLFKILEHRLAPGQIMAQSDEARDRLWRESALMVGLPIDSTSVG